MTHLPYFVAVWLFLVGLYGVVTSRHLVHLVVCLTVVQSSPYLLLLAAGPLARAVLPAAVLIELAVAALLLALAVQAHRRTGKLDPRAMGISRG